jgi:hypothetical protein
MIDDVRWELRQLTSLSLCLQATPTHFGSTALQQLGIESTTLAFPYMRLGSCLVWFLIAATSDITTVRALSIMGSEAAKAISTAQAFVDAFNKSYESKHFSFEQQFWGTKMALSDTGDLTFSAENLSKTKKEMYVEKMISDSHTWLLTFDGALKTHPRSSVSSGKISYRITVQSHRQNSF